MENRFQHFLLVSFYSLLLLSASSIVQAQSASGFSKDDIDSEFLELGANIGIINIEDFPSEYALGLNLTFRATEDIFLQLNLMSASDVDLSSAEKDQGAFISDGDRDFLHYDMLVGYNFFQGEFFTSNADAHLSTLHIVGGIGETDFGNESNFSYVFGLGYKIAFYRSYILNFDVRQYAYHSSLIADDDATVATHLSVGFSYLF
jgi:outer membrane beta-barrel protein